MQNPYQLTQDQINTLKLAGKCKVFLSGPAGSGKTTTAVHWISTLVKNGVGAESILIMVPQRSLGEKYDELISSSNFPLGGSPTIMTFGGLAQRTVNLFWPEIYKQAGFKKPNLPVFLTLETAQYFLAKSIQPLIDKGYFENLVIDRNRLYSQILDNLNKAALIGYPFEKIAARLKSAWGGEESRLISFDQLQEAMMAFRNYCTFENLLDYSFQIEIFAHHLWPSFLVRSFLKNSFKHLVFDNLEEETPVCHDIFREWLPDFHSALLIQDTDAGFRTFLGADPESAVQFSSHAEKIAYSEPLIGSPELNEFRSSIMNIVQGNAPNPTLSFDGIFSIHPQRYVPEMTQWVAQKIDDLITNQKVPPEEIVVLAPYMSDSLRFSLMQNLQSNNIPVMSNRPSRSLRDEPAAQAIITLARIAYPSWKMLPGRTETRHAFMQTLTAGDLVRAELLSQILYSPNKLENPLGSFDGVNATMQQRITYSIGNKFEKLKTWINQITEPSIGLDIFWSRLFGELLSQPGFGFFKSAESASVVAKLIESFQKFRRVLESCDDINCDDINAEFIRFVRQGVIASQYLVSQKQERPDSVLVAPAYSFLLQNHPVRFQFWLDIGSQGWWQRPDQPLTHPYVLSRNWPEGRKWTDVDEVNAARHNLTRLVGGLVSRCTDQIFICPLSLNERGMEERGPLLTAFNKLLKISAAREASNG